MPVDIIYLPVPILPPSTICAGFHPALTSHRPFGPPFNPFGPPFGPPFLPAPQLTSQISNFLSAFGIIPFGLEHESIGQWSTQNNSKKLLVYFHAFLWLFLSSQHGTRRWHSPYDRQCARVGQSACPSGWKALRPHSEELRQSFGKDNTKKSAR